MLQENKVLLLFAQVGGVLGVISLSEFYLMTQGYWGLWGLIPSSLALLIGIVTHTSNQRYDSFTIYIFGLIATICGGLTLTVSVLYALLLLAADTNTRLYL